MDDIDLLQSSLYCVFVLGVAGHIGCPELQKEGKGELKLLLYASCVSFIRRPHLH